MADLNLKGIWIPYEVLTNRNLSDKEKYIYSIILFLSKETNKCYCSNRCNKWSIKYINKASIKVNKFIKRKRAYKNQYNL